LSIKPPSPAKKYFFIKNTARLTPPQSTITRIGLALNFLKTKNAETKRINSKILKFSALNDSPEKRTFKRTVRPADAISAATHGLKDARTELKTLKFLYL